MIPVCSFIPLLSPSSSSAIPLFSQIIILSRSYSLDGGILSLLTGRPISLSPVKRKMRAKENRAHRFYQRESYPPVPRGHYPVFVSSISFLSPLFFLLSFFSPSLFFFFLFLFIASNETEGERERVLKTFSIKRLREKPPGSFQFQAYPFLRRFFPN